MTQGEGAAGGGPIFPQRLLRPRSIAIVGISARPGSAGRNVLANLAAGSFGGEIHLVGRSQDPIAGRCCLGRVDDLPRGIDLAIFTLPANAVEDALLACVRRNVGAVVLFASGFAEVGSEARVHQDRIGAIAAEGGLALIGPNCIGFTNAVEGFQVSFLPAPAVPKPEAGPGVALIGQSGGMLGNVELALGARGVPISYTITTGNEAGLGVSELTAFLSNDGATRVVAIYAEQVKRPPVFLQAIQAAKAAGKTVVLLQSGRSERSKEAAKSHTGALAGDYDVMRAHVEAAGAVVVDNLDELIDVAELAYRYPVPPVQGIGVLSASGAFGALVLDSCEAAHLDVPRLAPETRQALAAQLPTFLTPENPLDLSTQVAFQPELMELAARALAAEPSIGSMIYSTPATGDMEAGLIEKLAAGVGDSPKMLTVAVWGDSSPMAPQFVAAARKHKIPLSRSADRSINAIARLTQHGRRLALARRKIPTEPFPNLPPLGPGVQTEWRGKQLLKAIGVPTPEGGLAKTPEQAVEIAGRVGFPVALKAQASEIAHKTEAGALSLGLATEESLREAWRQLEKNVARARPGVTLEGMLVERMAPQGLDLMVGAKRDKDWGPLLLVGLGGIWVEVLRDTQLLTLDLAESAIVERLGQLRSSKLLRGFRGAPAADVAAVGDCLARIGRLMATQPKILEVDLNPLVALPVGRGVVALDALIVAE